MKSYGSKDKRSSDKSKQPSLEEHPLEEEGFTLIFENLFSRLEQKSPSNRRENVQEFSTEARNFYEKIPLLPPKEIVDILERKGYRGQDHACKVMALMAYRHIKRLKKIYVEKIPREELPPKSNILLMGPTGCGKTYLVELLFRHVLKIPTVIIDITAFSETGYIGDDHNTLLSLLLMASDNNPDIAMGGIICLDEFDKLASSQNSARFDGQGTTKDVSGYGVQKELLKMLEACFIDVPMDLNNSSHSGTRKIYTGDIAFIACGAFSGFKSTAYYRQNQSKIGFRGKSYSHSREQIAVSLEESEILDTENFQEYGFIPELLGRFTRVIPLMPLSREELLRILKDTVIDKFKREFFEEGLELEVKPKVLDYIVERSLQRQTGARGLTAELTRALESVAYEYFHTHQGKVCLILQGNTFQTRFSGKKK